MLGAVTDHEAFLLGRLVLSIAQNHARVNRFLGSAGVEVSCCLPWTRWNTRTRGLNGWWVPRLTSDRSTPAALAPLRCGAERDKITV